MPSARACPAAGKASQDERQREREHRRRAGALQDRPPMQHRRAAGGAGEDGAGGDTTMPAGHPLAADMSPRRPALTTSATIVSR